MGRKAKPTAVKILEGNPGKRALNHKEPKPVARTPLRPAHLKGEALAEWKRLIKELSAMGMIASADKSALTMCCEAWGDYVDACKKLKKEGNILTSEKGGLYQNPRLSLKKRSMDQVMKYYAEFGLTPSSRSRIKVDTPDEEDEMTRMLLGGQTRK